MTAPLSDNPNPHPEFTAELSAGVTELGVEAEKLFESCRQKDGIPPALFHFTDCDGLIGILRTKTLRASLATSLNDASETRYAIERLRSCIVTGSSPNKYLQSDVLRDFLDGRKLSGVPARDSRAYVVSFCATREAIHWLHYGRSGTGVALKFDGHALREVEHFKLCPIIYDTGK